MKLKFTAAFIICLLNINLFAQYAMDETSYNEKIHELMDTDDIEKIAKQLKEFPDYFASLRKDYHDLKVNATHDEEDHPSQIFSMMGCGETDLPSSPNCNGVCDDNDSSAGPDCNGVCDPGDSAAGSDCNGVCEVGENAAAPDCDEICDVGESSASSDCNEVCNVGESPSSLDCDGVCGAGDDGSGVDCNGVCEAGESSAGPDCDELCDIGESGSSPDCNGVCGAGDNPLGVDCDGICGAGDSASGPDCNGSCDAGDSSSGPDCNGVCDAGDSSSGSDCNGICGSGDSASGPDCNGDCDSADSASGPDCNGNCDSGDSAFGADCNGNCDFNDGFGSPDCDGFCDAFDHPSSPDCDPLPVELSLFKLVSVDCEHQLFWQTASEDNFEYFEVQQKLGNRAFEAIAKIYSLETEDNLKDYKHTVAEANYEALYRLKIVDLDGSFEYSSFVAAKGQCLNSVALFPNPATDRVRISFSEAPENPVYLSVTNVLGQTVVLRRDLSGAFSSNSIDVDISGHPSGAYLFTLEVGGVFQNFQVVKL